MFKIYGENRYAKYRSGAQQKSRGPRPRAEAAGALQSGLLMTGTKEGEGMNLCSTSFTRDHRSDAPFAMIAGEIEPLCERPFTRLL